MRLRPPALYYMVVERLLNRRISLHRHEVDGSYELVLRTCLSKQDAEERLAAAEAAHQPIELLRGRILITRLVLSNEAMGAVAMLYNYQKKSATKRRTERNRRQQVIMARLVAIEEATLNAELRAPEPVAPTPKPPRTPRAKRGEK